MLSAMRWHLLALQSSLSQLRTSVSQTCKGPLLFFILHRIRNFNQCFYSVLSDIKNHKYTKLTCAYQQTQASSNPQIVNPTQDLPHNVPGTVDHVTTITSPTDTIELVTSADAGHVFSDAANHASTATTHTTDAADTESTTDATYIKDSAADAASTANIKDYVTFAHVAAHASGNTDIAPPTADIVPPTTNIAPPKASVVDDVINTAPTPSSNPATRSTSNPSPKPCRELPTYIWDTTHALLHDFQFPGPQHLIFIMDIQSLYTCIPHVDGLKALRFFLSRRPNQSPSALIRLTELVLTLNNFSFNSSHFLQTKGVAMGTHMGPSYACLFVEYAEQSLFRCYTGTIPHLFLCYIDELQRFICTSVNVIYYIRYSRCGLFYISETKRRLGDCFVEHLCSVRDKGQHLLVANHFNSTSHSLGDMSILGLLQCHNDTTHKLEEQHLIFCRGSLQSNGQ
eukprot:g31542.t1